MCIDYVVFANPNHLIEDAWASVEFGIHGGFVPGARGYQGMIILKNPGNTEFRALPEESMKDGIFLCWKWLGSFGKLWWPWPLNEWFSLCPCPKEGPSSALPPLRTSLTFRNEAQMGRIEANQEEIFSMWMLPVCEHWIFKN